MDSYRYIESDDFYDLGCQWLLNKNRQKGEDCLLKALELNPCFIHAYIVLAGLYARQRRFRDSVHLLKKATRHDPDFDRIHFLMARYAYKNEDYVNARMFISRAIDINPRELYLLYREAIEEKYRSRRR